MKPFIRSKGYYMAVLAIDGKGTSIETITQTPDLTNDVGFWSLGGDYYADKVNMLWSNEKVYSIRKQAAASSIRSKPKERTYSHQTTLKEAFSMTTIAGKAFPGAVILGQLDDQEMEELYGILPSASTNYNSAIYITGSQPKERRFYELIASSIIDMVVFTCVSVYNKCLRLR